jgi:hypothetical protein
MFNEFSLELQETFFFPNSMLPEAFHDNVRGGRSGKRLLEMCKKRDGEISAHKKLKATKARNIKRMAAQIQDGMTDIDKPLDWSQNECDDLQLTKNMQAMVGGMINGGMLDVDDILESVGN